MKDFGYYIVLNLFEYAYIYTHALLKSKHWFFYKKPNILFEYGRARNIFVKVFQSKKLRGMNRTKTNIIFTQSERSK